jgi:hypothetical protein
VNTWRQPEVTQLVGRDATVVDDTERPRQFALAERP